VLRIKSSLYQLQHKTRQPSKHLSNKLNEILQNRGKNARVDQYFFAVVLSSVNIAKGFRFYFSTSSNRQRVSSIFRVQDISFLDLRVNSQQIPLPLIFL